MRLSSLFAVSVLSATAFAAEYRVGVGKDETTGRKGKGFDPSVIHPIAGDTIVFEFRSGAHSAVQSEFNNPCVWNGKFNSGVFTVSDNVTVDAPGLPSVTLTVNSTDPLWFFDEAGGLCHQGAVLAVNPTAAQTDVVFKENASRPPKPASFSSASPSSTGGASPSFSPGETVKNDSGALSNLKMGVVTIATASMLLAGLVCALV